jgi:hypothetical protein
MSATVMTSPRQHASFVPREHGATAMLLIPFFSAAILAREWHWTEPIALLAALTIFAAKDPLVVTARQRWIWQQHHPETDLAKSWLARESLTLAACGLVIAATWPLWAVAAFGAGALGFSALAVAINVRNKQRSTLFQICSAFALSATSLAACLSATRSVQPWCWWLWALCALQATGGILVVHARLEARNAARKATPHENPWRKPAMTAAFILLGAAIVAATVHQLWIAVALAFAGAGYLYDLHRQKSPSALQMSLKQVGLQAMSLSIAYALLLIAGLW